MINAFSMSLNKSKGHTLSVVTLQLDSKCFSHGQLHVAGPVAKPFEFHSTDKISKYCVQVRSAAIYYNVTFLVSCNPKRILTFKVIICNTNKKYNK